MKFAAAIFKQFGLFSGREAAPDVFELRLVSMSSSGNSGKRAARAASRPSVFKNRATPRVA